jgi:hypothetical protein
MCDLDDLLGMDGEKQLTLSNFWYEIAQAKEGCESESVLQCVIQNIINFYNVTITIEENQATWEQPIRIN